MRSQITVRVRTAEQPVGAIGTRMSDMRQWLDSRGIQLADFVPVSLGIGCIAFDACFRDPADAALFRAAFG